MHTQIFNKQIRVTSKNLYLYMLDNQNNIDILTLVLNKNSILLKINSWIYTDTIVVKH